eukprot:TRINITY_DN7574_c0_g1_i1.p1 TRINITY_DN7574_c0_g1~~TRINITY_DN7574_c0_g1_i1.p1  ORF type:complete len:454 (+),score=53.87 TRINITY_DN7574_c0_g1_i1:39-1364(+)
MGRSMQPGTPLFFVLSIATLSVPQFVLFFIYAQVAAVSSSLVNEMSLSPSEMEWLFAGWVAPCIVTSWIGAFFADRFGLGITTIMSTFFMACGVYIQTAGVYINSYPCLLIGRLICGFSEATLSIALYSLVGKFLPENQSGLGLGILESFGRLGELSAFSLIPFVLESYGWKFTFLLTSLIGTFAFTFGVIISIQDRCYARDYDMSDERLDFSEIKDISSAFWWCCVGTVFFFTGIETFGANLSYMVQIKYDQTEAVADRYTGLYSLIALPINPLIGIFMDKLGHRVKIFMLTLGIMLFCFSYTLVSTTFSFVPVILFGISDGLGVVTSACTLALLPQSAIPFAWALQTCLMGIFITSSFFVDGLVLNRGVDPNNPDIDIMKRNVDNALYLYITIALLGWISSIIFKVMDSRQGNAAELPEQSSDEPLLREVNHYEDMKIN